MGDMKRTKSWSGENLLESIPQERVSKGVMRTLLLPEKLLHSRSRSGGNISLCSIPQFKNKTNYLDSLFEIFPWDQVYISSSFHHLKSLNWDWLDLIEVEIGPKIWTPLVETIYKACGQSGQGYLSL